MIKIKQQMLHLFRAGFGEENAYEEEKGKRE
jgi:hypothetical protein